MIAYWTDSSGGNFDTAADWSTGAVPGEMDQARIRALGAYVVTISSSQGVLSLTTAPSVTLDITDDSEFAALEGTGIGANAGLINIADGSTLNALGTIDNTGSILLSSTGDSTSLSVITGGDFQGFLPLAGGGKVTLSNNADNAVDITTNVNNNISGAGTVSLSNNETKGVIDADDGKPLAINSIGQTLSNGGTLEATDGGELELNGTIDNASGQIEAASGGAVVLNGTIVGGKIEAIGTESVVLLQSGTLVGGTLETSGGGGITVFGQLGLEGTIDNTGSLGFFPGVTLAIDAAGVALEGGGTIDLADSIIFGNAANATLTNVNNTISGTGFILSGSNTLTLINKGLIESTFEGTGAGPLDIDTGTSAVTNKGTLEASAGSELYIASSISNTGNLVANDGDLVAAGTVTGTGTATIEGTGIVEFGAASSEAAKFANGSTGALILDDSGLYTGTVSGFGANSTQAIDLTNIQFATAIKSFAGGTLTIEDANGDVAKIKFKGTYTLADFNLASDGGGGTLVTDPPVDQKNHTIASGATVMLTTAATGKDTFAGKSGTLVLDEATAFSGEISGFRGQDSIDLADVDFGAGTTLGYAANGSSRGTLTVSDGTHTANLALLGNYMASSFVAASDGHGGTLITEAPQTARQSLLTVPHA